MDKNKLQLLRDIGYKLEPCCGRCAHSQFPNDLWGTCSMHCYDHAKHNGSHDMSIHYSGVCKEFFLDYDKAFDLHKYTEFVET